MIALCHKVLYVENDDVMNEKEQSGRLLGLWLYESYNVSFITPNGYGNDDGVELVWELRDRSLVDLC
jgi:hypothetical protein